MVAYCRDRLYDITSVLKVGQNLEQLMTIVNHSGVNNVIPNEQI